MSSIVKFQHPILVIDVETSGFDPQRNACLELGAVLLNTQLEVVAQFDSMVAPWAGAELAPQAMAVNRISPNELAAAASISEVVERFQTQLVGNASVPVLAGWNVWFDVSFLRAMYERAKRPWPFRHRLLDVQSVALFHSHMGPASQETAIKEAFAEQQQHRAFPDAMHTARLLKRFAERHLS